MLVDCGCEAKHCFLLSYAQFCSAHFHICTRCLLCPSQSPHCIPEIPALDSVLSLYHMTQNPTACPLLSSICLQYSYRHSLYKPL
ncbi:hypothetical protein GDO78_019191 [Eleutherodactylus coqui]|uniref:Uncharacterized protein n=1 Tax=Eleutherodactylus coqui TaxID=57060 RepID=A0A8J6EP07_ELECQ|nr:hypothetical protein GDO78_019191 [Eleutherodactylus coqui]